MKKEENDLSRDFHQQSERMQELIGGLALMHLNEISELIEPNYPETKHDLNERSNQ